MRPMRAAYIDSEKDLDNLPYPVYVSDKLDGRRILIVYGNPVTRNLKPIPNVHIRATLRGIFKGHDKYIFDGEITIPNRSLYEIGSAVSSHGGTPEFQYSIFDMVGASFNEPFKGRLDHLKLIYPVSPHVLLVNQIMCKDKMEVIGQYTQAIDWGAEGLMIRYPEAPYKQGQVTQSEGYIYRWKAYKDTESRVVSINQLFHNGNEQETNELGLTSRSSHQDNLIPSGMMGSLILENGATVGTGFNQAMRKLIWNNKSHYIGKLVKYCYRDYGIKDKPREVSFLEFRDDIV